MEQTLKPVPLVLLALFITKLLITGSNASDAGIVFALAGVLSVNELMARGKKIQEVEKHNDEEIEKIKQVVNKQNEVISKMAEEIAKAKSAVESVKLGNGMMRQVK